MTTDKVSPLYGNWHYPTAIRFGAGRISELAEVCEGLGIQRPLIVTDPALAALPMVADAVEALTAAGLVPAVFSDVRSNPVAENVAMGRAAFSQGGCDGVIGLGGGSALDVAKVIAMLAQQLNGLWDYREDWTRIPTHAIVPIVAVPTTAGTGSEVGRAAVITDASAGEKCIILHPGLMPDVVIADPALTCSLPPALTAWTGMDALAHNLEAFSGDFYHPLADGIALEALRLIHDYLPRAFADGDDLEARAHMMAAATMGAAAFQKALGAVHALSHPLGAMYDLHHGLTNAVVLPYVLVFNRPMLLGKMDRLAGILGRSGDGFDAVLGWLLELRETLGIPHTLAELDVKPSDIDVLAYRAARDPSAAENPVPVDAASLETIFRNALDGIL